MTSNSLSGEAREKRRRHFLLAIKLLSIVLGVALGVLFAWYADLDAPGTAVQWAIASALVLGLVVLAPALTWLWWRKLDEVDRLDQLWGAATGFFVYVNGYAMELVLTELRLLGVDIEARLFGLALFALAFISAMATIIGRRLARGF